MTERAVVHSWRRWEHGVIVRCPQCENECPLDHTVDAKGNVDPSLNCPNCPYHETVRLVGWVHGKFGG